MNSLPVMARLRPTITSAPGASIPRLNLCVVPMLFTVEPVHGFLYNTN